jgi:hypothetical protein
MKVLVVLGLVLLAASPVASQQQLPEMRSDAPVISIRDGERLSMDSWTLAPELDPDIYEAQLVDGRPHRVTFISGIDSLGFMVEPGRSYDFVVVYNGVRHPTRIVGTRFTPAAHFDAAYQARHRGTTRIQVPEVYELVNVVIALTPTAAANPGLVFENSEYRARVREWFAGFEDHPAVLRIDSVLSRNFGLYFSLKMNGYAFEFDDAGRIVKSPVYDRTSFINERRNTLEPFIAELQAFADTTGFRRFYGRNQGTYLRQIAFYRDSADVAGMLDWLRGNFPGRRPYDTFNVIFSPLVGYNQSVTWLESNGFSELQPHVNFPYLRMDSVSEESVALMRGNILFTELNHGFINPEADRYSDRISRAISNRNLWVDSARGPGFYGGNAAFNEYMNWVLVSLYLADRAPAADQPRLLAAVDRTMIRRGFPRFPEFSAFLVDLYRNRGGRSLADLYPDIIAWFDARNRSP